MIAAFIGLIFTFVWGYQNLADRDHIQEQRIEKNNELATESLKYIERMQESINNNQEWMKEHFRSDRICTTADVREAMREQ